MATDVKLPRLGQGMESGVIVRWLKSEGDAVSSGEPLYELDTDKVTQEVEADVDGTLLKIVVTEGEVAVGSTVAVIGEDGEATDSSGDESARSAATVEPGAEQSAEPTRRSPSRSPQPPKPRLRPRSRLPRTTRALRTSRRPALLASTRPQGATRPAASASRPLLWRGASRASRGSTSRR